MIEPYNDYYVSRQVDCNWQKLEDALVEQVHRFTWNRIETDISGNRFARQAVWGLIRDQIELGEP